MNHLITDVTKEVVLLYKVLLVLSGSSVEQRLVVGGCSGNDRHCLSEYVFQMSPYFLYSALLLTRALWALVKGSTPYRE